MAFVFLDGEFLPENEAKISVMNRGFLFGDGAYATVQIREGKACFLEMHLLRLKNHCLSLGMEPPFIDPDSIQNLIKKNEALEGIWRLKIIITGNEDPLMRLPKRSFGHLIIFLTPFSPPPFALLKMGIFPLAMMHSHASFKSLAHLNRYYVMEYAYQKGYDDCLTKTESGFLLEAAFGNLLIVNGMQAATPDPQNLPLHYGVTITIILGLLQKAGYEVNLKKFKEEEIEEESLLFRTNTMSGLRPIESLNGKNFGRDKNFEEWLLKEYEKAMLCASPLGIT